MNEIIDGNVYAPANLARRKPPLQGEKKRGNDNHVHTARVRKKFHTKTNEPFTVRVKRKFNNAKVKLARRLGLYAENFQYPLGMYVDYLA